MQVGIKGKGSEIKWVDIQELPTTKEFVKFKKESEFDIAELKKEIALLKEELEKAKLKNVRIVKELISR